jgi:hypothetical protein
MDSTRVFWGDNLCVLRSDEIEKGSHAMWLDAWGERTFTFAFVFRFRGGFLSLVLPSLREREEGVVPAS